MNVLDQQPKDQIDKDYIVYQQGFQAGQNHSLPSPKTMDMFTQLSNSLKDLSYEVKTISDAIHNKDTGIMKILGEISEQTKKTNGRVNKIENWKAGIVAIVSLLSFVVPSAIGYYVYRFDMINEQVITLKANAQIK